MVATVQLDLGDGPVCGVARLREGRAGGDDVEDPAAGGDEEAVGVPGGAGVEDVDVVVGLGGLDAGDGVAGPGAGVAVRGDDDVDRVRRVDAEGVHLLEAAVGGGVEKGAERGWSLARETWPSGSPKRALNSTTRGPLERESETDVEGADERGARRRISSMVGWAIRSTTRSARSAGAQSSGE